MSGGEGFVAVTGAQKFTKRDFSTLGSATIKQVSSKDFSPSCSLRLVVRTSVLFFPQASSEDFSPSCSLRLVVRTSVLLFPSG